ncbi:AHH domain-containing protein [Rodentibacter rarus]|nr:AHH domain-containing protein [Rodentibacter rarus]
MLKEGKTFQKGDAAAHIVASTGSKGHWEAASRSRELLAKYRVNINDAANGIPLGC